MTAHDDGATGQTSAARKRPSEGVTLESQKSESQTTVYRRSPTAASANRARAAVLPTDRLELLERYPEARQLSLYDGRVRLGAVILLAGRRPAVLAFGTADQPLGCFSCRRSALQAVGEAFDHLSHDDAAQGRR